MAYTADYARDEPAREAMDRAPGFVLVEFGAPWCPHCQAVQASLSRLLAARPEIQHVKIEDGKGRPLGRSFAVKLWPNLVGLKDGQILFQLARPSPDELQSAFARFAATSPP